MQNDSSAPKPLVVAIEMGYGHLRAAYALSDFLNTELLLVDAPPLATPEEQAVWTQARRFYESVSRISQIPVVGGPIRRLLEDATAIPHLFPRRDLSSPTAASKMIRYLAQNHGLGAGMFKELRESGRPLLTTFFAPALVADAHGYDKIFCVVTDSDINRVWAPVDGAKSNIIYLAPTQRVVRRLQAYGVPPDHIHFTGFPLPSELLGGEALPALKQNLQARIARLDPDRNFRSQVSEDLKSILGDYSDSLPQKAPLLTFAVGGAGAQSELVRDFLPGARRLIESARLRLALVAGIRGDIADRFRGWIKENQLEDYVGSTIQILHEPDIKAYFPAFNRVLAETDILWTKPSEMTFFGALGLALLLAPPVGVHERYNRRWAIERGAAIKQRDARYTADHIEEWIHDGTLAAAAWSGFMLLPKHGTYLIPKEIEKLRS